MKRSLRWVWLLLMVGALAAVGGCKLFNADPVADFDWSPNEPLARSEVRFEDESRDEGGLFGGGGIVSWNWDFDDGDSASGQNPKHEFGKSGDYDVTLTVTDGGGKSNTVEKTIEVTPSLHGTWQGQIIDPGSNVVDFRLVLQHSATGGITGTRTCSSSATTAPGSRSIRSRRLSALSFSGWAFAWKERWTRRRRAFKATGMTLATCNGGVGTCRCNSRPGER